MSSRDVTRILLVEDDDDLRDSLTQALEEEGYRVHACSSGPQAIELAHQEIFELVISDIRMAGMDGLDTLERLQERQPTVATLVITGFSHEADTIRAVKLGVGDYLKKPFRLDEFLTAVENQLSLHHSRQIQRRREQSLRQFAVWAMESFVGSHEEDSPTLPSARLAREIGLEMGLAPDQAIQPQLALLVEACRRSVPGGVDVSALPGDLREILEELQRPESSPGEGALPSRIAKAALKPDFAPQDSSALARAWQRAHARSPQMSLAGYEEESSQQTRRRRSLLQLGRSLEQSGQAKEASATYHSLVATEVADRESVEAYLGLMRLSVGEAEACRKFAQQAVALGGQGNSLLGGLASLEAGLYLARAGLRKESQALLEQASRLAQELAQPSLQAKALVALAGGFGESAPQSLDRALTRLLEFDERYELIDSAWWLLPCLLRLQAARPHPLQEKLLTRLGRDAPSSLLRLLQSNRLEPAQRLCAVGALAGSSHPSSLECLKMLSVDSDPAVRLAAGKSLGTATAKPVPPTLRIYTLGGFEICRGEERLPKSAFNSWRQRFLLARLASSERPIPVERIIDEFWQGQALDTGRVNLNSCVYYLRRALRPANWPEELEYLVREPDGIRLNPELPIWHDYNQLVEAPSPESEGNPSEETVGAWQRAVQVYRGPYLDQCYMDWATAQRQRAEVVALAILRRLVAFYSQQGRGPEVLDYGARVLEIDPCCQEAHLALMRAHLLMSRPEAALRQFDVCKKVLHKELNLEPSIAILEAHQRALLNIG